MTSTTPHLMTALILSTVSLILSAQAANAAWAVAGGSPYRVSWSTEADTVENAKRGAMDHCRRTAGAFASRCKVMVTGKGGCVGTAYNSLVSVEQKRWFVATGPTEAVARKAAVAQCSSEAPGRCQNSRGFCEKPN